MSNPTRAWLRSAILLGITLIGTVRPHASLAQDPKADEPKKIGQFFTVVEPITDTVIDEIRSSTLPFIERAAAKGVEPVLIFEFLPGETKPGQSSPGNASDLAEFLSTKLSGAEQTIAYVPKPLSGYAALAVLACDEIVMGDEASLGPIAPEGQPASDAARAMAETLARRKGRDADLLLGMLDPSADLREVRTADRQVHFVLASRIEEFKKDHQILSDQAAWEGGRRGVLTAERARDIRFTKLLARNRAKVAEVYGLESAADDPTLGGPVRPALIRIEGPIDTVKESFLRRRIAQAVNEQKTNLIVFAIDSEGGQIDDARGVAESIGGLGRVGVKTVAFVDRALGLATLPALACDEIVMAREARIGDITKTVAGQGEVEALDEKYTEALAGVVEDLAREKFHPEAVSRALVDPKLELVEARDQQSAGTVFISMDQALAEPDRYAVLRTIKAEGDVLTLDTSTALELGLARKQAESLQDWLAANGLKGIRIDGPTWVDSLVTTLNTPWMSWLLLFIGMFMLILELKLPGVGLPAITSALAFLLFFWGHYLGGTADRLEIMLFLVGLICVALELFVFPGFGVFGVSGILLVLGSVVMASHTFVWPTQEYEFRQMGRTLTEVTLTIVAVVAGAVVLGRYFPSLPLFRRMILVPEVPGEEEPLAGKPAPDTESSLFFLLGETGRTTTVCRPSGKARFGEMLVDVTADGFYIEADSLVEAIEVRGTRVFVKKIG